MATRQRAQNFLDNYKQKRQAAAGDDARLQQLQEKRQQMQNVVQDDQRYKGRDATLISSGGNRLALNKQGTAVETRDQIRGQSDPMRQAGGNALLATKRDSRKLNQYLEKNDLSLRGGKGYELVGTREVALRAPHLQDRPQGPGVISGHRAFDMGPEYRSTEVVGLYRKIGREKPEKPEKPAKEPTGEGNGSSAEVSPGFDAASYAPSGNASSSSTTGTEGLISNDAYEVPLSPDTNYSELGTFNNGLPLGGYRADTTNYDNEPKDYNAWESKFDSSEAISDLLKPLNPTESTAPTSTTPAEDPPRFAASEEFKKKLSDRIAGVTTPSTSASFGTFGYA